MFHILMGAMYPDGDTTNRIQIMQNISKIICGKVCLGGNEITNNIKVKSKVKKITSHFPFLSVRVRNLQLFILNH